MCRGVSLQNIYKFFVHVISRANFNFADGNRTLRSFPTTSFRRPRKKISVASVYDSFGDSFNRAFNVRQSIIPIASAECVGSKINTERTPGHRRYRRAIRHISRRHALIYYKPTLTHYGLQSDTGAPSLFSSVMNAAGGARMRKPLKAARVKL